MSAAAPAPIFGRPKLEDVLAWPRPNVHKVPRIKKGDSTCKKCGGWGFDYKLPHPSVCLCRYRDEFPSSSADYVQMRRWVKRSNLSIVERAVANEILNRSQRTKRWIPLAEIGRRLGITSVRHNVASIERKMLEVL